MTAIDRHSGFVADIIFAAVIVSDTTVQGPIIDTTHFLSVNVFTQVIVLFSGTAQGVLLESDDANFVTNNVVDPEFLIGSFPLFTPTLVPSDFATIGYVGKKRFIRVVYTTAGGTAGTAPTAVIQAEYRTQPAPVQGLTFN